MLKEFNHIARQMLFLHGHLVRPADWAEDAAGAATKGRDAAPGKRSRALRLVTACVTCGAVTPLRFVSGQIR